MAGGRRKPEWSDIRGRLHMRLKDAAAELDVSITYLRRLCRENGLDEWPGKKIRFMNATGKKVRLGIDEWEGSPWPGLVAGSSSQLANTVETKEEDGSFIRIHHPPAELTTLNLIDKVGLSSGSRSS